MLALEPGFRHTLVLMWPNNVYISVAGQGCNHIMVMESGHLVLLVFLL